ncbi:MAG: hypothetical protein N2595_00405 [bacterium]|nr:hypothetical protein [bacterium]
MNTSAFVHADEGSVTVVLVNMRPTREQVIIQAPIMPPATVYQVYRTSSTENFARQADVGAARGRCGSPFRATAW